MKKCGRAVLTWSLPGERDPLSMMEMWECHGHFLGTRTFDLAQLPLEPEALRAARCTHDLRAALDAGDPAHVTAVWTRGRQVKGIRPETV